MADPVKVSDGKLLYDPMFAKKPELDWKDSENKGIFGKAIFKKVLFIIVLILAIAGALFFSFSSLSKARYEFTPLENGTYKLNAFHGQKTDTVLNIDFVRDEESVPDESKVVSSVRQYTITGNDTLQFIFVSKDVADIEKTAFYYCTALNAIYVDPANENYADIDGVLYKKENGVITEAVFCPQQHTRYMVALALGDEVPADSAAASKLAEKFLNEEYINTLTTVIDDENSKVGKTFTVPETVTKIDRLCFAYCDKFVEVKLPAGLKEIETMAFFKCSGLETLDLPDTLEVIGSDAFTKCGKITYLYIPENVKSIGHHAFSECGGVEKVYMAAENLDGIETGENWLPQYRKTFMKNREIVFSAERGVK